jgi:hypothetical protein
VVHTGIPALRRKRHNDLKFKTSLGYIVASLSYIGRAVSNSPTPQKEKV